jgi:hypothetical protein
MQLDRQNPLTPKQEQAVVALMTQQTVVQAAESVGVNKTTLYRWLDEPAFVEAYRKARRETFSHAIAMTQRYAGLAVNTLAKVMMDERSSASAKVQAATSLLRFGREGLELEDLAARIESLECAAREKADPPPWHAVGA